VVLSILKFTKAMQQFALCGVDFGCNLLDQKLRALAQQEAPRVTSFVDRLSDARIHWIAGCRSQCACSVAPGIDE
jgi:ferredoxin